MDVADFINRFGFPIAVAVWLALRVERKIDAIVDTQRAFGTAVKLLAAMQGIELPKEDD